MVSYTSNLRENVRLFSKINKSRYDMQNETRGTHSCAVMIRAYHHKQGVKDGVFYDRKTLHNIRLFRAIQSK